MGGKSCRECREGGREGRVGGSSWQEEMSFCAFLNVFSGFLSRLGYTLQSLLNVIIIIIATAQGRDWRGYGLASICLSVGIQSRYFNKVSIDNQEYNWTHSIFTKEKVVKIRWQ